MNIKYRPDIDGLRAIAVLAVIFYHANFGLFSGGFTGVDVFFVISGFLITSIIVDDIRHNKFSFARFYRRRILRIFPALITVVLFTLVAGYFFLLPSDYSDLSKSSLWTLLFSANFYFLLNTGYFDQAAGTMPLLHTWSLGVEEQFYIVWPVFVLLLYKAFKYEGKLYWALLAGLLSASLALNIYCSYNTESFAFYSPVTRAWELLTGAAIATVRLDSLRSNRLGGKLMPALPWIGLVLTGFGIFYLTDQDVFPGFAVILPVLGTALLILAGGCGTNPVSRWLAAPLPVFFGKISYSLYLWHWPIFTYYRHYIESEELDLTAALWLIAATVAISALSWKMIEQPARRANISNGKTFVFGGAATVAAAAVSLAILMSAGFQNRLVESARNVADRVGVRDWKCNERLSGLSKINDAFKETIKKPLCVIGAPWKDSDHKAILWGDSHAGHFVQLLDFAARRNNVSIAYYFSCPPYLDHEKIVRQRNDHPKYSETCGVQRKEMLRFLETAENIDLVIFSAFWSSHYRKVHEPGKPPGDATGLELMRRGLTETIAQINPSRIPVLIISDVPGGGRDMTACVVQREAKLPFKKCTYEVVSRDISELEYHAQSNRVLAEIAARNEGVYLINSVDRLCDERKCDNYINNEFIYRDSSHLRINLSADTVAEMSSRLDLEKSIQSAIKSGNNTAVTLSR